jgi:16S rRNA C967 or C1407 C5-methylase (RsmB/RsmF family)
VINDNFQSYREIIPEFSQFQESLRRPLLSHLRVNRLKVKPDLLVKRLTEKGIDIKRASEGDETLLWAPDLKSPGNLLEYFLGYIHPQALTSCLVSIVLSPRPDSYVLDMCASPGGKTSHMAQLMDNTGLIIANELYPSRHIPLGHTLARLGVLNAVFTGYQAQEFPLKEQRFDHILADVPCSGEGRFRITLLKDKGEMVYATCTYNPEENESVVNFLLKNREAELLPVNIGINHEPGLSKWRKERYDEQLRRAVRVYPHHVDSVGFFMAKIGRRH